MVKSLKEFRGNKKGWMRIIEAFIAILLIMTVMLVVIQRQRSGTNVASEIETRQKSILTLVSGDELLRSEILSGVLTKTSQKVDYLLPPSYNYSMRLCLISDICGLNFTIPGEVYSQETLITANLTYKSPVPIKLKLFFWRGPYPEGFFPPNYSEPITDILPECVDECSIIGMRTCADITHNKTCGEFDSDSCKEWSMPFACGANKMCQNGDCVQAVPVVSVSFSTPVRHTLPEAKPSGCAATHDVWYYYDMTVSETTGISNAIFGSRLRCYYSVKSGVPWSSCDALNTNMPSGMPTSLVAGQSVTVTNRYFCLQSGYRYNVTETFYSDASGTNRIFNYTVLNVN